MLTRKFNAALMILALTGFGIAHADNSGPDEPFQAGATQAAGVTEKTQAVELRSSFGSPADAQNPGAVALRAKAKTWSKSTAPVLDRFDTSRSS